MTATYQTRKDSPAARIETRNRRAARAFKYRVA